MELMCDDSICILDFVAFVQDNVRPTPSLEPAILSDVAIVRGHANVESDVAIPNG